MFKGTKPRTEALKRKLSLGTDEDSARPAKVIKTFTSTPEELVKLCGAFVQATSAACNSRLTPVRMKENLIDRFERARDRQAKMAASVNPGQPPEAEGPTADQPAGEAAGGKAVATPASNFGPAPAAPPAPNSSRGGGGRGG